MTDLNQTSDGPHLVAKPSDVDPHQAQYDPDASYTMDENLTIRARQAARSRLMGLLLAGLCAMFFGITLAKIGYWS